MFVKNKGMNMKIVLVLIFILSQQIFAQLQDKIVPVENISDSCSYGKHVLFRDTDKDNQFDKVRRYYCDFSYDESALKVIGSGIIESGMVGELIKGEFNQNDLLLKIKDPFKNIVHAYLWYDSTDKNMILDFTSTFKLDLVDSDYLKLINDNSQIRILTEFGSINDEFAIYSLSGILMIKQKLNESNIIDITNLIPGIYLLQIGDRIEKFIKF